MNDDTSLLPTGYTIFFTYFTELLHVSAIYPGLVQGVTSLVDEYSAYDNL